MNSNKFLKLNHFTFNNSFVFILLSVLINLFLCKYHMHLQFVIFRNSLLSQCDVNVFIVPASFERNRLTSTILPYLFIWNYSNVFIWNYSNVFIWNYSNVFIDGDPKDISVIVIKNYKLLIILCLSLPTYIVP
jgi:hypothetical protein